MVKKSSKRPRRRRRGGRRRGPRPSGSLEELRAVARRRFGVETLRPLQEEALTAVLAGRDVVAVLPTGYGKSLVYQLPALVHDRPTLVVSPLIALMRDQERSLRSRNVPVVRLDGTLKVTERRAALARIAEGGPLVVLTTPETLESESAHPVIAAARPWLLCVDEAHCISEWGHDFRPAYLALAAQRELLGDPQVLALTATATPRVRASTAERLGMQDPVEVVAPPHRDNLRLEVELVTRGTKPIRAGALLRELDRPGIVYCATTVEVESLFEVFTRAHLPVARYHGKLGKADREEAQKRFMRKKNPLWMIATSAFGMGVDKPDIRSILHYQAPGSLEQYIQEAGRAGRDGKPSRCVLLYDEADLGIQRLLQDKSRASGPEIRRVAKALGAWTDEDRAALAKDIALAAGVPVTRARTILNDLEELGAVQREGAHRLRSALPAKELARRATDLGRRLETKRREDEARLALLDDYANATTCRSAFIRRAFGEVDPPECGHCDMCQPEVPRSTVAKSRRGGARQGRGGKGWKKSKKRARRKRKAAGQPPVDTPAGAAGEPKRKRRRRPRRRGKKRSSSAPAE